jgi:hypothetical protein
MVEDSGETLKMGGGLKSSGLVGRDSEDLEFDEDFKNKVKLREGGMGEPPSLKEIERFLKVKERLRSLLEDKRKQRGLVYRLGLKKRNSNIDQEIREMGEEYHQLLIGVKVKTGYSDEEVREYIEGGRAKKVENALVRFQEEIEEAKERLGPGKKKLYGLLKQLARDKRVQFLMGTALTGTALVTPPSGFVSMLVLGLNPDYLPFDVGSIANGATLKGKSFLLRDVLKERRERQKEGLRTVKVSFTGSDDLTEEEEELRDIRIEKTKEEKQKKTEEKFSQEQLLEEVILKEEEVIPQKAVAEEPEALVKEREAPLPEIIEEAPAAEEEVLPVAPEEAPAVKEEVAPEIIEEAPPVKEEAPLPEVVEEIQTPVIKEETVVEAPLVKEEVPLIVRKPAIVKKEKVPRKRKSPEKDLSLAQLQEMEEELLTGKPPEEEKDKKK